MLEEDCSDDSSLEEDSTMDEELEDSSFKEGELDDSSFELVSSVEELLELGVLHPLKNAKEPTKSKLRHIKFFFITTPIYRI